MFKHINHTAGILIITAILGCVSCKQKSKDVLGCTDAAATNYNSAATISTKCNYLNEQYAGTYVCSDTSIIFRTDLTRGWYDTLYSSVTITVTAPTKDTLIFDKVITSAHYANGAGMHFSDNCRTYTFADGNYPYESSGNGYFAGGRLFYYQQIRLIPTSNGSVVTEWGNGYKLVY